MIAARASLVRISVRPLAGAASAHMRDFTGLSDHTRLPARFFGRLVAEGDAALSRH